MHRVNWILPLSLYPHDLANPKPAISKILNRVKNRIVPELRGVLVKYYLDKTSIVPSGGTLSNEGNMQKLLLLHPELDFFRTTFKIPVDVFCPVQADRFKVKVVTEKPTFFITRIYGYSNITVIILKVGEDSKVEAIDGSFVELTIGQYLEVEVSSIEYLDNTIYVRAKWVKFIDWSEFPSSEYIKKEPTEFDKEMTSNQLGQDDLGSQEPQSEKSSLDYFLSSMASAIKPKNKKHKAVEDESRDALTELHTSLKKKVKLESSENNEPPYGWQFTQESISNVDGNDSFFLNSKQKIPSSPDIFSDDD